MSKLSTEDANNLLPTEALSSKADPLSLCYTLIATPKWGKTTWLTAFPDSVLLAFEQGHAFIKARKIIIDVWDERKFEPYTDDVGYHHLSMQMAVDALCASDQFKFVIFDTADMAGKMCLDYHLNKNGLTHPGDLEYGKGYDVCLATPFRQMCLRILKTGRGIGFITHTEIKDVKFSSGAKSKRDCTMVKQLTKFIIPQSDLILNGTFGKRNKQTKKRDRIIITEGSDDTLAGNRAQGDTVLPNRFIVDLQDPWAQWSEFFTDPKAAARAEFECNKVMRGVEGEEEEDDREDAKDSTKTAPVVVPAESEEETPKIRKGGKKAA